MNNTVNLWIALSQQALDEFKTYRTDPDAYSGPMTPQIYKGLSKMSDTDGVQKLFSTPTIGGKVYSIFSLYFNVDRDERAKDFIDYMTSEWPTHFIVIGAWWVHDGRQVGTQFAIGGGEQLLTEIPTSAKPDTYVEDTPNWYVTTGTPTYPIPTQAYRLMPDTVTYDVDGNETSRTPASSNADLKDINLISGQWPRRFV
jgi:hypothetical protein